jgi:tetratricopeptide (TPR) repeat protein
MNKIVYRYLFPIITSVFLTLAGCAQNIPRFGIGGRYEEGREEFLRGRGGDMDKAIVALESVVSQDPTYKNSLTYLGRAYYRKGRYQDAFAIMQRALAVNKDDEIAWISLGLTQLRLGQNEKGVETLKGGITLANKVLVEGYHNYQFWDDGHVVRNALRRSAFLLVKGVDEKPNIIGANDQLLALIDDEENFQKNNRIKEFNRSYNSP